MLSEGLLQLLADGRPHAPAVLAHAAGIGPAELPGRLQALRDAGLELHEHDDRTIALARPIRWIDRAVVDGAIGGQARARVDDIVCLFEHESTNRYLLAAGPPPAGRLQVALAEYQHGGRGRRGRRWLMPPGTGIALSAAWRFAAAPAALAALSLAVGAAARRAILDVTGVAVGLKWPNDLYHDGGKLGGILVELDPQPGGMTHVVAGIGINVDLPAAQRAAVSDLPGGARDLAGAAGQAPDRSVLAGSLIRHFVELFAQFGESGFAPYRDEWTRAHVLDGVAVTLHTGARTDNGIVRGIEADGALLVEDAAGARRRHTAGDVTVRIGA